MESLKAQLGTKSSKLSVEKENGALAHELGHLWFISQFPDPSGAVGNNHAYGGWAPDWLDESAAILMENAVLRDQRREALKELDPDQLIPLETFFMMEHPLAQAAKNLVKDQTQKGNQQVVFLTGEEADKFLKESGQDDAGNFYSQVAGFAQYMIETTGDKTIFAKIAAHLSKGSNVSNWIETSPHFKNLAQLDSAWQAWVGQN